MMQGGGGMKLVCYGDSNTYGYDPEHPDGRYGGSVRWADAVARSMGMDLVNLGRNGREIPRRAPEFADDAALITVMLGTNDSAMRGTKGAPVSPDRYRHNLLCIIDSLHARYPGSYFILHRPLWYSPNTHNGATYLAEGLQRLQTYTPVLDELPLERPYILPGDRKAYDRFRRQHRKLLTPEAGNSGTFYLHPNKAGAEVLAGYWTKSIIHNMKNYVLQDK